MNVKPDEDIAFKSLPWLLGGGITASLMKGKANAKDVKTCPLKCPTFNEAKRVSE